jgi:hypothetical protein
VLKRDAEVPRQPTRYKSRDVLTTRPRARMLLVANPNVKRSLNVHPWFRLGAASQTFERRNTALQRRFRQTVEFAQRPRKLLREPLQRCARSAICWLTCCAQCGNCSVFSQEIVHAAYP